ncbi:MAG: flagellin, partial [Bermanella sp.]
RELAVQSANATNSASDRQALDLEVQQRLDEISRIGSQTSFNGQKILDGSFGTATFQVGANVGETVNVSLSQGVKSDQLGQISTATTNAQTLLVDTSAALAEGGTQVKVGSATAVDLNASADLSSTGAGRDANSAYSKVEAINASGVPGLTATASTSVDMTFADLTATTTDFDLSINGETIYSNHVGALTGSALVSQINLSTAETGVTASISGGEVTLSAADGRNISVTEDKTGAAGEGFNSTENGNAGLAVDFAATGSKTATISGNITLAATETVTVSGQTERLGLNAADATFISAVDSTTISSATVSSVAGSNNTIQRIDSALETVSNLRSTFGAVQSRFESTITNLQTISENLSSSRSRIQDADFAAETAKLTKAQILQQAGISILAQANSAPQSVLALLQ